MLQIIFLSSVAISTHKYKGKIIIIWRHDKIGLPWVHDGIRVVNIFLFLKIIWLKLIYYNEWNGQL